jgi:Suppressor of fused protein (SUFU)
MLTQPQLSPAEFQRQRVSADKTIHFLALIPLTTAEMEFKLQHGAAALLEKLKVNGVTELVDPRRKSVV